MLSMGCRPLILTFTNWDAHRRMKRKKSDAPAGFSSHVGFSRESWMGVLAVAMLL